MTHVASAVITISANRIVYADGNANRGLSGSAVVGASLSVGWASLDMTVSFWDQCQRVVDARCRGVVGGRRRCGWDVLDAEASERVGEGDERVEERVAGTVVHRGVLPDRLRRRRDGV